MKTNFILSVLAYAYWGFGIAVKFCGRLDVYWTTGIFISSMIFFVIIALTSLQKVKDELFKEDKTTFK